MQGSCLPSCCDLQLGLDGVMQCLYVSVSRPGWKIGTLGAGLLLPGRRSFVLESCLIAVLLLAKGGGGCISLFGTGAA